MPRLSKPHAHALAELRAAASQPLLPDRIASAMLAPLEDAIGWDGHRLFGVDPRTLLINRLLSASDNDRSARREWLEEVYLDPRTLPYLQLPEMLRARLKAAAYQPKQEQSWGYPRSMLEGIDANQHWSYYFESQSPVGGTLHAGFEAGGRQIAVLQAYRRDPNRAFQPRDVSLMQLASSLIGEGLERAFAREQAHLALDSPASGIMFIDSDRAVTFATPAGTEWIERLRSIEADDQDTLPIAIWSAAKGLADERGSVLRVATMSTIGPVILEASEGGNGSTAIVIAPDRQQAPLQPPSHWGLTSQQEQIAMHVISGASNREIAGRLFLSEHTIEWHLRQIYRALDLSSRTQLQARFFRDVGLASYRDLDPD